MFVTERLQATSKDDFYRQLREQAAHLVAGEPNYIANLSNLSALLMQHLSDVNWVGFYLTDPKRDELVLGPFQGLPACLRIPFGRGVCGKAVAEKRPLLVADVHEFPGHIACDSASQSEVVIPLMQRGVVVGVLDIDSPLKSRFDNSDLLGLEYCAKIAEQCLTADIPEALA
ncbi:MAG: GAF domain-containing protein [Alicyclobacillaceae bacterium]|jgi:GAF domain-containing protein|uniref:GAF domain-containing protein n=1 Tax=Alicyclobacillus sp. SP_1 TaxID=2942475 RepID=UPI002157A7C8|nr:GAF domain-containing protein [Alicyclobacillus sp. SP_1]MCY0887594.1 GAF domain-containing protein [Alicyclobacillaceae bacterium]